MATMKVFVKPSDALIDAGVLYFGDTARFPYGDRTQRELEAFALEIAEELIARRVKLLVVACNSATAAALPALRERLMQTTLGIDVLGVVQPGAVQAVAATRNGRVSLLVAATPGAVERGVKAGAIVKAAAQVVGGGGGGRDTMAQAGGRDPGKLDEALATARAEIERALGV